MSPEPALQREMEPRRQRQRDTILPALCGCGARRCSTGRGRECFVQMEGQLSGQGAAMQKVLFILQNQALRAKFSRLVLKQKPFFSLSHAITHGPSVCFALSNMMFISGGVLSGKALRVQTRAGRKGRFILGCYQPGCCSSAAAVSCDSRRPAPSVLQGAATCAPALPGAVERLSTAAGAAETSLRCAGGVTALMATGVQSWDVFPGCPVPVWSTLSPTDHPARAQQDRVNSPDLKNGNEGNC